MKNRTPQKRIQHYLNYEQFIKSGDFLSWSSKTKIEKAHIKIWKLSIESTVLNTVQKWLNWEECNLHTDKRSDEIEGMSLKNFLWYMISEEFILLSRMPVNERDDLPMGEIATEKRMEKKYFVMSMELFEIVHVWFDENKGCKKKLTENLI